MKQRKNRACDENGIISKAKCHVFSDAGLSNETIERLPFVFDQTPPTWLSCSSEKADNSGNLFIFQISNIMIFCAAVWLFIKRKKS